MHRFGVSAERRAVFHEFGPVVIRFWFENAGVRMLFLELLRAPGAEVFRRERKDARFSVRECFVSRAIRETADEGEKLDFDIRRAFMIADANRLHGAFDRTAGRCDVFDHEHAFF